MAIQLRYHKGHNYILSKLEGSIDGQSFTDHIDEICKLSTLKAGWIEIIDMSSLKSIDISYQDCLTLSKYREKLMKAGCAGAISYAPNDLTFGISRMLKATCENKEHPVCITKQKRSIKQLTDMIRCSDSSVH